MNYPVLLGRLCAAVACASVVVALAAGCGSSKKSAGADRGAVTAPPGGGANSQVLAADLGSPPDAADPSRSPDGTPRGARMSVTHLDIYQLAVPLGAISRSEEFWKHIDEQQVDVGTYDLLRKNGWRVGTAPSTEWPYFRDIIDAYPASAKPHRLTAGLTGTAANMELSMKEKVDYQVVSYFDDENLLHNLSFDQCDNLLSISLQQVPRKPGEARVTVCPTVRSLRRRFQVNMRQQEREFRYVHPERLYDLNLQADIPAGQFLIIAPSPEVRWPTSLGAAFLVENGAAEQFEHVLLLVPRVVSLGEMVPSRPAAPGAGAVPNGPAGE
jgi:hypothetical protein